MWLGQVWARVHGNAGSSKKRQPLSQPSRNPYGTHERQIIPKKLTNVSRKDIYLHGNKKLLLGKQRCQHCQDKGFRGYVTATAGMPWNSARPTKAVELCRFLADLQRSDCCCADSSLPCPDHTDHRPHLHIDDIEHHQQHPQSPLEPARHGRVVVLFVDHAP